MRSGGAMRHRGGRARSLARMLLLAVAAAFASTRVPAQEDAETEREQPAQEREPRGVDAKYDEQLIDEVIVRGGAWRTPEPPEPERAPRWRTEIPPAAPQGRISFGYDPSEDLELRRSNPLYDKRPGEVEPATIFRVRF